MIKKYLFIAFLLFSASKFYAQTPLQSAVDFSVKTLKGDIIQLYPLLEQNKIVVIDFFSTSCGPCQTFAYDFQMAYEAFGSNSGDVFFLAINYNGTNPDVIFFDSLFNITLPSASGLDGGGNLAFEAFQIAAYPTVVVVKPDKTIAAQHVWEPNATNITEAVLNAGGALVGKNEFGSAAAFDMSIFPNPVIDVLNFKLKLEKPTSLQYVIRDLSGKVLIAAPLVAKGAGNHVFNINTSMLATGQYLLEISVDSEKIVHKIFKGSSL